MTAAGGPSASSSPGWARTAAAASSSASGCPRAKAFARSARSAGRPRASEEPPGLVVVERAESHLAHEPLPPRAREPVAAGRLAPDEDRERLLGHQRQEGAAQPRVHQPEGLVGVEREDGPPDVRPDEVRDELGRRLERGGAQPLAERDQEAGRRRLHVAAVEVEDPDGRAGIVEHGLEQTGLAHAAGPGDEDQGGRRPALADQPAERGDLGGPPDEGPPRLLGDALAQAARTGDGLRR